MPDGVERSLNAATQLKDSVNLQKAIIVAVLHNYFVIAAFSEKYSLDHLPVMLGFQIVHKAEQSDLDVGWRITTTTAHIKEKSAAAGHRCKH